MPDDKTIDGGAGDDTPSEPFSVADMVGPNPLMGEDLDTDDMVTSFLSGDTADDEDADEDTDDEPEVDDDDEGGDGDDDEEGANAGKKKSKPQIIDDATFKALPPDVQEQLLKAEKKMLGAHTKRSEALANDRKAVAELKERLLEIEESVEGQRQAVDRGSYDEQEDAAIVQALGQVDISGELGEDLADYAPQIRAAFAKLATATVGSIRGLAQQAGPSPAQSNVERTYRRFLEDKGTLAREAEKDIRAIGRQIMQSGQGLPADPAQFWGLVEDRYEKRTGKILDNGDGAGDDLEKLLAAAEKRGAKKAEKKQGRSVTTVRRTGRTSAAQRKKGSAPGSIRAAVAQAVNDFEGDLPS